MTIAAQKTAFHRPRQLGRGKTLLAAALLLVAVGVACADGSYPVDFFYEMHYQDSYGPDEPPRLSPPEGSVPWFSAPSAIRIAETPEQAGSRLFVTNCSMCHGVAGEGDGAVLRIMESKYGYRPALTPDLTSDFVQVQPDEGLLGIISGGLVVMPSFQKLLSEEELQLVLDHVRTLSGGPIIDGPEVPVFIAKGCGACHTIEGLEGAVGTTGPELTQLATRGSRVDGLTTEEYIRQSEEEPQAFIVPGFDPVMPNLRGTMTDQEFEDLISFLLSLE